jgi:hypothetical protein
MRTTTALILSLVCLSFVGGLSSVEAQQVLLPPGIPDGPTYYDECHTYENSRVVSSLTDGTYCGQTGDTCTECYNLDGIGGCFTNHPRVCLQNPSR